MDITEVAKEIRTTLKGAYPNTKFRVKSSRFSQGSSVDIFWMDGPAEKQVDDLVGFHGDRRCRFVTTSRSHSADLVNTAIAVWRKQNPEYAHLTINCKGGDNRYAEFDISEFMSGIYDLRECENSLNRVIHCSSFDGVNLVHQDESLNLNEEAVESSEIANVTKEKVESVTPAVKTNQQSDRSNELKAELQSVQIMLNNARALVDSLEAKTRQLILEVETAAYEPPQKARISKIILTREEGTIAESGKTTITSGWLEAEQTIKLWAKTVSSPTWGDKCTIIFEFADGNSFSLRFDLMQKHRFVVNLAQELKQMLTYMAGEIPPNMTQEEYQNYCKFCKIDTDAYKRLLDGWDIPA